MDSDEEYIVTSSCVLLPKEHAPALVPGELLEVMWPDLTKACEMPLLVKGDTDEGLDHFMPPPAGVLPDVVRFKLETSVKLELRKKGKYTKKGKKEIKARKPTKKARRERQTKEEKQV